MALRVITADSFGGLEAARANADQRRQMALVQAFEMNQRIGQEAARQRELRDSVMRQDRNFNEGVRQFDVNTGLYRDQLNQRALPKPLTTEQVIKFAADAWNVPDDQYKKVAALSGASPEQIEFADSAVRQPLRQSVRGENISQSEAAQTLNLEPRKRAIMQQQLEVAKDYTSSPPWWAKLSPWSYYGTGKETGAAIAPGVAAQQAALAQRVARARTLQNQLQTGPGGFEPTSPMPAGMIPWSPTNRFAMPPRTNSIPIDYGTNAPVMNLPRTNSIPMMRPNVPPMMMPPVQMQQPAMGTNGLVRIVMPDGRILRGPAANAPALLQLGGRIIP